MDYDLEKRKNRFGRVVTTLVVLPDPDISDNEVPTDDAPNDVDQDVIPMIDNEDNLSEDSDIYEEPAIVEQNVWSHVRKPKLNVDFLGDVEAEKEDE